jgi:hypothetical protein
LIFEPTQWSQLEKNETESPMDSIAQRESGRLGLYRRAQLVLGCVLLMIVVALVVGVQRSPSSWHPVYETWARPIYAGVLVFGLLVVVTRRLVLSPLVLRPASRQGGAAVVRVLFVMTLGLGTLAGIVGVGGPLLYQLTGDAQYLWRLGGIGLLLLIYSLPRRAEWERAFRQAGGGGEA